MHVDPSVPLPDNYEWEEEQLDVLLEEFLGERVVADETLRSGEASRRMAVAASEVDILLRWHL